DNTAQRTVVRLQACNNASIDQYFVLERGPAQPKFRLRPLADRWRSCLGVDTAMDPEGADILRRICNDESEEFTLDGP
ncbi:MAG: hypothetical protein ACRDQ0_23540, partial [Pseudonocardia sp.]